MTRQKLFFKMSLKIYLNYLMIVALFIQTGCATTGYGNKIAGGMLAGAAVGAVVGNSLSGGDTNQQDKTRNTIISSLVFSLIAGGALAWHYQQIEQVKIDISGRYARYRLCDPENFQANLEQQLEFGNKPDNSIYQIQKNQLGKLAISLDDSTKWVYPSFRKRYLQPEREENQVISERYIWEIIKPGSFVTRSQNPEYFFENYKKDSKE